MRIDTVQLAVRLPRNLRFRKWVTTFTTDTETVSEDQAVRFIRIVCEIESRRELSTNPVAEQRFHELLFAPFVAWRDARH
ncbi:hypothetical protein [Burkholderia vietnamiensis]|uniref:hypothetical protein n=1 Tax=Burkholderia vietnamiensis TaxID=60552 RepID=UPI0020119249|nr:hypothetical protein [Burkholderia vietnamiensis]